MTPPYTPDIDDQGNWMADVFVSYARADESKAQQIADTLRQAGYSVWRDDQLPAHRAYADVIRERLRSAKAVVVIWSAEAAKSQWVRSEADAARQLGTLIQARVDKELPPMPFDQIHCADLEGWGEDADAPGWRKLSASVAELVGPPSADVKVCATSRRERAVCVLPFQNMSGDPEQEYFSDGISEDITTDLSKVSALAVSARNTAFQFKGQSVDVCDVARRLRVSHVLEGSVRKAGNRIRVTAQLIDGASGDHVWAERYDRDLTDIFAIQDEISHAIVAALKLKLMPEEKKAIEHRATSNVDAYNLYLMARQTWVSGTHGDIRREETVIRLCDRILEIEPKYGKAWALKAVAQAGLFFGYNKGAEDGVESAEQALRIDPALAEAYSVKARALASRRKFADAEKQIKIALQLDRQSWEVNKEAAAIYLWQRKFAEAVTHYEKCVELIEDDRQSWDTLILAYREVGDEPRMRRAAETSLKLSQGEIEKDPRNASAFGNGANSLVILGDIDRAKDWIDRALLIEPDNLNIRYNFACILLNHSNEVELAYEYIEYAFARSVGAIVRRADIDSDLDRIRDHPRFQQVYSAAMERIAKLDAERAELTRSGASNSSAP